MTQITIGMMARAPVPGHCKSRLAESLGAGRTAALYEAMLRDSLDAFGRCGVDRYVLLAAPEHDGERRLRELASHPWEVLPQSGDSFEARLRHGFETLMSGGDACALVDSDSPIIDPVAVGRGLEKLGRSHGAVMGPAADGGYYLLGLAEPRLGVLDDIPWSTSAVADATRTRCHELGLELFEVNETYDVDVMADLERLRADLRARPELAPKTAAVLARFAS